MKLCFITDEEWLLLERNHSCPCEPQDKEHVKMLLDSVEGYMIDVEGEAGDKTERFKVITDLHANILLCLDD